MPALTTKENGRNDNDERRITNYELRGTTIVVLVKEVIICFCLSSFNDKELQFSILDINTKEIIYVSEPIAVVEKDDSFTRLRDLKVSENKVYILDSNHTLHIFQREQHQKHPIT